MRCFSSAYRLELERHTCEYCLVTAINHGHPAGAFAMHWIPASPRLYRSLTPNHQLSYKLFYTTGSGGVFGSVYIPETIYLLTVVDNCGGLFYYAQMFSTGIFGLRSNVYDQTAFLVSAKKLTKI